MEEQAIPPWYRVMQMESAMETIERETRQRVALEEWMIAIDERIAAANAVIEEQQAALDAERVQ
jgi:hypothetical protein